MMIDGASVGLGILMEEVGVPRTWKVVFDSVAQRAEPKRDGKGVGAAIKGNTFTGKVATEDDVDWLEVEDNGTTKYMRFDSETVGLETLLEGA